MTNRDGHLNMTQPFGLYRDASNALVLDTQPLARLKVGRCVGACQPRGQADVHSSSRLDSHREQGAIPSLSRTPTYVTRLSIESNPNQVILRHVSMEAGGLMSEHDRQRLREFVGVKPYCHVEDRGPETSADLVGLPFPVEGRWVPLGAGRGGRDTAGDAGGRRETIET